MAARAAVVTPRAAYQRGALTLDELYRICASVHEIGRAAGRSGCPSDASVSGRRSRSAPLACSAS
jgi:hypothetical protein